MSGVQHCDGRLMAFGSDRFVCWCMFQNSPMRQILMQLGWNCLRCFSDGWMGVSASTSTVASVDPDHPKVLAIRVD